MENMSKIAATLPNIEDELLMSDEERDLQNQMAPEASSETKPINSDQMEATPIREIAQSPPVENSALLASRAEVTPIREIAPTLRASSTVVENTEAAPIREIALKPSVEVINSASAVQNRSTPSTAPAWKNSGSSSSNQRCAFCNQGHKIRDCRKFHRLSHAAKVRVIVSKRLCSNCLTGNHFYRNCPSPRRCQICQRDHHTLLHPTNNSPNPNLRNPNGRQIVPHCSVPNSSSEMSPFLPFANPIPLSVPLFSFQPTVTLAPTIILNLQLGSRKIPVRALLDSCSGHSRICQSLVQKLQLGMVPMGQGMFSQIKVESMYERAQNVMLFAQVMPLHHIVKPSASAPESIKEHYAGLQLADPEFYRAGHIGIVLGSDVYPKIIKSQTFSNPGFPWAQLTIFGWVIMGPCSM